MALKADRKITDGTDIGFFCNLAAAERGAVVVLSAGGSGAAMDDSAALVTYPTVTWGSGEYPVGILMNDVVSGDLTKTHLNQHKDEVQTGGKVTICRRGTVLTNMIEGSPTAGQYAYIGGIATDGKITGVSPSGLMNTLNMKWFLPSSGGQLHRIGTWLSSKDSDGYAKLDVNLI